MAPKLVTAVTVAIVTVAAASTSLAACPDMSSALQPGVAWCRHAVLPKDIVARADAYIAAATDKDYQKAHYRILPEHAHHQREGDCSGPPIGYSLTYHYAPLMEDGAATVAITVYVPSSAECAASGDVVLRDSTGAIVEPTMQRAEVMRIARRRWPDIPSDWTSSASLSTIMGRAGYGWRWQVSFTGPGTACWPSKTATVDARSGELLESGELETCM